MTTSARPLVGARSEALQRQPVEELQELEPELLFEKLKGHRLLPGERSVSEGPLVSAGLVSPA